MFRRESAGPILARLAFVFVGFGCVAAFGAGGDGVPATAAEASKALDLVALPLAPGSEAPGRKRPASLEYAAKAGVKDAYAFHRKQLLDAGWKEAPTAYVTDESASNTFEKGGFTVTLMVYPNPVERKTAVMVKHLGNVDLAKLPVPPGSKPLYQGPATAMSVTEAKVPEAAEFCRQALVKLGWEPYGEAGDTRFYKRNAVRLSATVSSAPGQDGKTVVQYGAELMSVELPAPPDVENLQYSETTTALFLDAKGTQDEVFDFYRKTLGAKGWKATTDAPFKSGFRNETIFRNDAKDMMTLQVSTFEGKSRTNLKFETGREVAEAEKRAEAKLAQRKKAASAPAAKVAVPIPADASAVNVDGSRIEFQPAAGKTGEALKAIREALSAAGWGEEVQNAQPMAGLILFKKGNDSLTLIYTDTGFLPAEINLSAIGVQLERAEPAK